MNLYELIIAEFPELADSDEFALGSIRLQNDSDGTGDYIAKWEYAKPLPKSLEKFKR
jgi:hypothetical protein